ncbi:hypothetical protein ABZX85_10710 [Streptomyces sp. NPDC004539]|uniref:hypothetical protein n=1 Tax=Streptomyces sp. NPDC004539 TaxID=3154280 RepID=UPI0033B8DC1E
MRLRKMTTPDRTYRWSVHHVHRARTTGLPCQEVLTLHRDGVRVRFVFEEGTGRWIQGSGYTDHSGSVSTAQHYLNLHLPSVARAFADESECRNLFRADTELNGWEHLPAVSDRVDQTLPARS